MLQVKNQSEQKQVPLKRVNIEARIQSFAADVTITQVFRNDESTSIEAVYCFPIEEQAAVYAFRAHIDNREIIAELKKKDDAQREYIEALQQGHGAYLLEQDEKSLDNFIVNIGALPPNTECDVTISYVTELDLIQNGSKIRFVVPTTIAPRYNPNVGGITAPANTTSEYVQSTPYTIKFCCQVEKLGISRVSSVSHPIQVALDQDDVYVVDFAQQDTHLDRDILLDIELAENCSNTIIAVEPGVIMASFTPSEEDCRRAISTDNITNEFIFVIDCSGSMDSENKIELVREAMLLFVKSLPVDCHFNIIRFGSNYENLFHDITAIYNQYHAQKAEDLVENMKADLGGTELLLPLQWLKDNPPERGHSRQVFLLTDGEISNVDKVLNLCRSMSESTRIFSFGLGFSPSRSLVKGLARSTNGRFVFIPPYTNVGSYVGEQLQKALQPCITNVQIKWNLNTTTTIMNVVPINNPPVYVNDRLIVYAFLEDQSAPFDHNMSVELYSGQHRLGEAHVNQIPTVSNKQTIARLATKALILELQHEKLSLITRKKMTVKRIVELSLKYNILSTYTAFIGIEKRVNANNADMVLRQIPIQISADDQHLLDQQLCYSKMNNDQEEYYARHYRFKETVKRFHDAHMRCRDPLEHYRHVGWKLHEYEEKKERLRMDYLDSMRSSRTHHADDKHREESKNAYPHAQNLCHKIRIRWMEAWNELESCQEERMSAEWDVYKALEVLRSYGNHKRFDRGYEQVYQCLESARKGRKNSRYGYDNPLTRCLDFIHSIESSEYEYSETLKALDACEADMFTGINISSSYGSYGSAASNSLQMRTAHKVDDDQRDIVGQLIRKQKFDGLWELDSKDIEKLIGKTLEDFQQWPDTKVLTTAIIIAVLETRFVSFSSTWHGIVQKARKCLTDVLNKDNMKLDTLLEDIKKQL